MSGEDALLVPDYERDDRTDTTVSECHVRMHDSFFFGKGGGGLCGKITDLDPTVGDESAVDAVVAVVGRRRGSWRRLETPASRLKEELDLPYFEPLEKLCLVELARENMLAPTALSCHVQCREF